jgi:ribosomal protein L7/L12
LWSKRWPFEGVTADVEAQLIAYICSGHTVNAIKLLRSISGQDLVDAKWMIEHLYGTAGIPLRGVDAGDEDS